MPDQSRDNRTLLIVIAVFCAITAAGTLFGLAIWGYSWWQASRLVDTMLDSSAEDDGIETGRWSGTFAYPGGRTVDMSFRVESTDPVSGTMTFGNPSGGDACVVSATQTSRSSSAVTVTTAALRGPDNCAEGGRWEITATSGSVSGELVWSSERTLIGSSMRLTPG